MNVHHKYLLLHTNILHEDYHLQSPNDTHHEQLKNRTLNDKIIQYACKPH